MQEKYSSMTYLFPVFVCLPVNPFHLYVKTRLPCCILFGMQTSKGSKSSAFLKYVKVFEPHIQYSAFRPKQPCFKETSRC